MATDPAAAVRPRPHAGAVARAAASALVLASVLPAPAGAAPAPAAAQRTTIALTMAGEGAAPGLLRTVAGGTARGAVRVQNLSARPVTVLLQRADIRNGASGDADYVTAHPARAGRWVRLSRAAVRLAPGAARRVPFTVRVPPGTVGASHYAGIVAVDAREVAAAGRPRPRRAAQGDAGFTIARVTRQALPLSIRLPGPLTRTLTLRSVRLDVQPGGAGLVLGLLPRGTVLAPGARVRLRVARGPRTVLRADARLGQLFPDSRLDYRVAWSGRRPIAGDYRVTGWVRPDGGRAVRVDRRVTVSASRARAIERATPAAGAVAPPAAATPGWMVAALIAAGVALLALLGVVVRLARRSARPA